MVPMLHTTPMPTTNNESNMALTERKKSNKMSADNAIEAIIKIFISLFIRSERMVRINGSPLMRKVMLCLVSKALVSERTLAITSVRSDELKILLKHSNAKYLGLSVGMAFENS